MKKEKNILVALVAVLLSGGVLTAQQAQTPPRGPGYLDVHMHLTGSIAQDDQIPRQGMRHPQGERMRAHDPKSYEAAAQALISMMDSLGVKKAIVMPPPHVFSQKGMITYKGLKKTVDRHPDRLAFAGGGDNLNPMIMAVAPSNVTPQIRHKFRETAQQIVKDGAVAFGEMAALHFSFGEEHVFEQTAPDHPLFLLLADIAAEKGVPIDLHMEAVPEDQDLPAALAQRSPRNPSTIKATIPGFERLLDHKLNANIVWQHVGWDNTGHMTPQLVRRILRAHPNLFCALKFVRKRYETFQAGEGLMDADMKVRSEWLQLMSEFPDRFMIGADEFIGHSGRHHAGPPSFEATWAIINQLPEELRNKIGRENARRVYRLND